MAASIESSFRLIDQATPVVRKIKRELSSLERQAHATGRAMDKMAGPRAARQLEGLARDTGGLRQEAATLEKSTRRLEVTERSLERQHVRTAGATHRLAQSLRDASTVIGVMKWPTLIAGAGGATQALGGLAAGAVALGPKLLDAGGAAASGGTLLVGFGAAAGVAKLATKDLSEALGGSEKALRALTPEGRAFLQTLRGMEPAIARVRRVAQRGLFPGATDLMGDLRSQAPEVRGIVRQTAGDLGGLARFAGRQVAAPAFMRDLTELSDQGGRALGSAGRSAFRFATALEQVMIAAGPLTDWLGQTVEGWSRTAEEQARAARASGALAGRFERTRESLTTLGDTAGHVWGAVGGVLDAATDQGDSLWESINRGAERWDEWSNSFAGQQEMASFFDDVRPALDATVGLVGDVGEAFANLARGPAGARMLESLRDAVPDLADGIGSLTANLGPAAVDALAAGAGLFGTLAGEAGPLTAMARALGLSARAVDRLLEALGPVGPQVATLATSALLLKKMGFIGGGRGGGAGGGGALLGVGAGMLGGKLLGGRGGRARGLTAADTALVGGGAMAGGKAGGLRGLPGKVRTGGLGGLLGGAGVKGVIGAAGKFMWPITVGSGVLGALGTDGGVGARVQGAANAMTFGIVPRPVSKDEKIQAGYDRGARVVEGLSSSGGIDDLQQDAGKLRDRIRGIDVARRPPVPGLSMTSPGIVSSGGPAPARRTGLESGWREETKVLKAELHERVVAMNAARRLTRDTRNAQSVEHGAALAKDFAGAFRITAAGPAGPVKAMDDTVTDMLAKIGRMRPAGAEVLAESAIAWAKQQADGNPRILKEVERLKDGIEGKFSRMGRKVAVVNDDVRTGSQREWKGVRLALTSQTERAREKVSQDFTAIQRQAVGSLTSMGFSAKDAQRLVGDIERGGKRGRDAKKIASYGPDYKPGPIATGGGPTGNGNPKGDGPGRGPVTANFSSRTTSTDARTYSMGVNSTAIGINGAPRDQPRPRASSASASPIVLVPPAAQMGEVIVRPEIHVNFRGDFRGDRVDKKTVETLVEKAASRAFTSFAIKVDDEVRTGSEVDVDMLS